MRKLIIISISILVISGCSNEEPNIEEQDVSMVLICKFNSNALYEDRITFNKAMTSATRTSTNKSNPDATYKVRKELQDYILIGTQTKVDINKNKTLIPDVDLFVLTTGKSDYWNWDLYYAEDFKSDPFKFMACHER